MKDKTITKAPSTTPRAFQTPIRKGLLGASRHRHQIPPVIIATETNTGAITGPTHGTGIRKRMSQVNKEAGQATKTIVYPNVLNMWSRMLVTMSLGFSGLPVLCDSSAA